ncbi:TetR/AcrR family transcriptional regulator [Micrococcus sp.]|uniref:TetR/AcrR family transcriptional regulator n=1 Tax=Micrococcus sp. TaxID=1271 RepID=UPI002A918A0F|nr:TetR family transcriptional regulator C-terminal domain-containing protein [Micrococcus sp.]MDY6054559.1 TetR family transcriptional regulator C-terminal domain-containing protein [Micrococcus sp.]
MAGDFDPQVRRRLIHEAVVRLLVREGIDAVSLRNVAREAGLALGSLRYIHPCRADLLIAVAEELYHRNVARAAALVDPSDPAGSARALAEMMLLMEERDRPQVDVYLALMTEARHEPRLRRVRDSYRDGVRRACERIVRALGPAPESSRPLTAGEAAEAARLHVMIDGLAVALHHRAHGSGTPEEAPEEAHEEVRHRCRAVLHAELDRIAALHGEWSAGEGQPASR